SHRILISRVEGPLPAVQVGPLGRGPAGRGLAGRLAAFFFWLSTSAAWYGASWLRGGRAARFFRLLASSGRIGCPRCSFPNFVLADPRCSFGQRLTLHSQPADGSSPDRKIANGSSASAGSGTLSRLRLLGSRPNSAPSFRTCSVAPRPMEMAGCRTTQPFG